MAVSVFDIFKIGIGPSSSHTVGPMRAARLFVSRLQHHGLLPVCTRGEVKLYGSLGATGKGDGTDRGVMLGLSGEAPDTIEPASIGARLATIRERGELALLGRYPGRFVQREHIVFYR